MHNEKQIGPTPQKISVRWRSERGAEMVEFALSIMLFLAALFLTVDVVRLSFQSVTSQLVAGRAIRLINVRPAGKSAEVIFNEILNLASRFGLKNPITICVNGDPGVSGDPGCRVIDTRTAYAASVPPLGNPRQMVALSIRFNVPMILGTTNYEINAAAVGRNEPFED